MIPLAMLLAGAVAGGLNGVNEPQGISAAATAALSAGLGAGVAWLGSAYFAWQAFRHQGARAARQMLGGFYRGMIGKFVLIVLGLGLVFHRVHPLSPLAVLAGLVVVQSAAWWYPWWRNRFPDKYRDQSF